MKAILLDRRSFTVVSKSGEVVVIKMELFRIQGKNAKDHPEGFRLGWIAYSLENPQKRVLFDSHPPKGPHFHIDDEKDGTTFRWESLEKSEALFFEKVGRHFDVEAGDLT